MIPSILNLLQLVAVLPDRGQHQIVSHLLHLFKIMHSRIGVPGLGLCNIKCVHSHSCCAHTREVGYIQPGTMTDADTK